MSRYVSCRNVAPGHPSVLLVRAPFVPLCPSPGGALLLCGILLFMLRDALCPLPGRGFAACGIGSQIVEGWNACTWIVYPGIDRTALLRRATPRCFGCARRLYSEAPPREGPSLCAAYCFLYGGRPLTSLFEGGGTRACERDGRSVPTRVTPSASVPSAPPPKVEVKGRSPERKPFWYNPSASHSLGTVPLAASLSHKGGLVSCGEKNCKKAKTVWLYSVFFCFLYHSPRKFGLWEPPLCKGRCRQRRRRDCFVTVTFFLSLAPCDEDEKPDNRTSAIQSGLGRRRLFKAPVGGPPRRPCSARPRPMQGEGSGVFC